jgi:hypothetical protein
VSINDFECYETMKNNDQVLHDYEYLVISVKELKKIIKALRMLVMKQ